MKIYTTDHFTTNILFLLVFLYLLTSLQILTPFTSLFRFSLIFFITCIFLLILKKKPHIKVRDIYFFLPIILFQIFYVLRSSTYTDVNAYTSIFYQGFFFLLLFVVSSLVWKKDQIKTLSTISIALFVVLLILAIIKTQAINPNTIGAYAYFLSFFPLLYFIEYKSKLIKPFLVIFLITLSAYLIFLSNSRSVLVCVAFSIITYKLWSIITKRKLLYRLYFFMILIFSFLFTTVYPKINTFNFYNDLEFLMYKYTGKNLLSGRDYIWNILLDLISNKLWLGYGAGALPSHFFDTDLSSHNLYLQISLQVGILGLILLLIFLYFIWMKLRLSLNDKKTALVASYFVGIIIYQLFEITLTQNNFGLAIIQWLIIGLGLSLSFNKRQ